MSEQFKVSGYHITTDPQFQNKRFGIVPELERQMESLYFEAQDKKNKKIFDKLTQLILKYPTVPLLKNYLSVAYNTQGNYEKAREVNEWILYEHPDYLFGLINRANQYIENDELDKVPGVLGEGLELKKLYPERDLFHLAEITGYYNVVVRYYAAINDLELAEDKLDLLKEIAPDHPDTEQAEKFLFMLRMASFTTRMEEEKKQRITPTPLRPLPISKNTIAPQFNHPEIEDLYHFGIAISHAKLEAIIALPRTSLIEDLEKILLDAVDRYNYFSKIKWEEETHNFVIHALFILGEIKATQSLPKIVILFEYDKDFVHYWFGDHVTETVWQCFYILGFDEPDILKPVLLQPGVNTYFKSSISTALAQIVLYHSEKRDGIFNIYSEVLTFFSMANIDDNVIDTDVIAFIIGDAINCNFHELLPIIQELFDKKHVAIDINGDFKKVQKEFGKYSDVRYRKNVCNIYKLYDHVLQNWYGYKEARKKSDTDVIPQLTTTAKIGRNDPCPCGSGKKYKKCCLK